MAELILMMVQPLMLTPLMSDNQCLKAILTKSGQEIVMKGRLKNAVASRQHIYASGLTHHSSRWLLMKCILLRSIYYRPRGAVCPLFLPSVYRGCLIQQSLTFLSFGLQCVEGVSLTVYFTMRHTCSPGKRSYGSSANRSHISADTSMCQGIAYAVDIITNIKLLVSPIDSPPFLPFRDRHAYE